MRDVDRETYEWMICCYLLRGQKIIHMNKEKTFVCSQSKVNKWVIKFEKPMNELGDNLVFKCYTRERRGAEPRN